MNESDLTTGGCLCGQVSFELKGELRPVTYCHCEQCRKTSGHFVASTAVSPDGLRFLNDQGLAWYKSSAIAERGFCKVCGSSLFWRPAHGRHVSVMAGTLSAPTGLSASEHIYVADASDYYVIADGLRQYDQDYVEAADP